MRATMGKSQCYGTFCEMSCTVGDASCNISFVNLLREIEPTACELIVAREHAFYFPFGMPTLRYTSSALI